MRETEILILGAGLSGTLLASQLEAECYSGEIVLLDARTDFSREQRWCSWAKPLPVLNPVVKKSWQKWSVLDWHFSTTQSSPEMPYRQIYAPDFYDYFHSRWKEQNQVSLFLGEEVYRITESLNAVEVLTNKGVWRAKIVFDARSSFPSYLKTRSALYQTFFGFLTEFKQPIFDAETITLMDFRLKGAHGSTSGVNFIYILPYSANEALIESTSFSLKPLSFAAHQRLLREYIEENFGADFAVKREEKGMLPMTIARQEFKCGSRVFRIGINGGAIRPSSGYAFHRIQRQVSQIASSLIKHERFPQGFFSLKYDFLDSIFLELIALDPIAAKKSFLKMFSLDQPDALIRFLMDESSLADDAKVISVLPKTPFLKALWRHLSRRLVKSNDPKETDLALLDSMDEPSRRLAA